MKRYVNGLARNLGRFGQVEAGEVVILTDEEAAHVERNPDPNLVLEPVRTEPNPRTVTQSGALPASGGRINVANSGPVTLTLPSSVSVGLAFQIYFDPGSSWDDITIDPGENSIEGQEGTYTLTAQLDSVGLYWTGAAWRIF